MRRSSRYLAAVATLAGGILSTRCSNELAPTSVATVTLKASGTWPDSLAVAEIATVVTDVVGANGTSLSGIDLEWSSSDSSIVQVTRPDTGATPSEAERLSIGRRAIITTHAAGTANIVVRLNRSGLSATELRVPVVVRQRNWPALLTVSNEDTVGVGLTNADPAVLGPVSFAWLSSDPSILQATPVAADSSRAQLTARAGGTAQVTLTVTGERLGHVEFREPFSVGGVQIVEQPANLWGGGFVVGDGLQGSKLLATVCSPSRGHVGLLVPSKHSRGTHQVEDFIGTDFEFLELFFGLHGCPFFEIGGFTSHLTGTSQV